LFGRGEVPFGDGVCDINVPQQDLGEVTVLKRDVAVGARKARGGLRDAVHPVGVMVAAGEHEEARRRAERRGAHVVEKQAVGRQGIDV
jgi:hypothetical protein